MTDGKASRAVRIEAERIQRARTPQPIYYECGICSHIHHWDFKGDCRQNSARLTLDDVPATADLRSWADRVNADLVQS